MNRLMLVCAFVLLFANFKVYGQCDAISCNDNVQISLDTCVIKVLPNMLLESENGNMNYRVELFDHNKKPLKDSLGVDQLDTRVTFQVFNDCNNSCWGEITPELNIVFPQVTAPCQYIPSLMAQEEYVISTSKNSDTLEFELFRACEAMVEIEITSDLKFDASNGAGLIWKPAEVSYSLLNNNNDIVIVNGGAFTGQTFEGSILLMETLPLGKYKFVVKGQDDSTFGNITVNISTSQCNRSTMCTVWCASAEPYDFITLQEFRDSIDASCSIPLLDDIYVDERVSGNICDEDGQIKLVSYMSKAKIHGKVKTVVLLQQAYVVEPLDISGSSTSSSTVVIPPAEKVFLDCFDSPHPDSIVRITGIDSFAFPQFIDPHNLVDNIKIISRDSHYLDTTSQVVVQQMVALDKLDPTTGLTNKVWVLADVIVHKRKDTILIDTIVTKVGAPGYVEERPRIRLGDNTCNINTFYTDQIFEACNNGTKIIRSWTSIDWCSGSTVREFKQTIEIIDRTAPKVTGLDSLLILVDPWSCNGKLELPKVLIEDNCTAREDIEIRYESTEGFVENGILKDVPNVDTSILVTIIVTDACNNSTRLDIPAVVYDNTQPVAVCPDVVEVSLTHDPEFTNQNSGTGKIKAEVFDQGSHDGNCSEVSVKVIRMVDTEEFVFDCEGNVLGNKPLSCDPFTKSVKACGDVDDALFEVAIPGDYVKYCCEDVGNDSLMVMVIVTDESGNENRCMVRTDVNNKLLPVIQCDQIEVDCIDDFEGIDRPALIGGICPDFYELKRLSQVEVAGVCSIDTLKRSFYIDLNDDNILNQDEPNCEQTIVVKNTSKALDPYTIKWPKHFDGTVIKGMNLECDTDSTALFSEVDVPMGSFFSCMAGAQDVKPVYCNRDCGLVATSVESDTLIASDACLKIINRWKVIDWCTYSANGTSIADDNDTDFDQFIPISDWAQGECTDCPEYGPKSSDPVYFKYTEVDLDGYYTFDQIIKIVDDSAPEIILPSDTIIVNTDGGNQTKDDNIPCYGSAIVTANASDLCGGEMSPSEFIRWEASVLDLNDNPVLNNEGDYVHRGVGESFSINTRTGENGQFYKILWTARDGCGNISTKRTIIKFGGDTKAPVALCITNVSTQIMDNSGSAVIWAKDFDTGSFDNCTISEDLVFSIVPHDSIFIPMGEEGFMDQSSITINCDMLTDRFESLDVYITDESGNSEYCTVALFFSEGCDFDDKLVGNARISGAVFNPDRSPISDVEIRKRSTVGNSVQLTNNNGEYAFNSNPMSENYLLDARKTSLEESHISTFDILVIQKYILGLTEFENSYQILASDVNHDGKISSSDILEIRKNILGLDSQLDDNPWMFLDANTFDSSNDNPWNSLQEDIAITGLNADRLNTDFVGVKLGDINGNSMVTEIEQRGQLQPLSLRIKNRVVEKGETVELNFTSPNFKNILGYQFEMALSKLKFKALRSGMLQLSENNISIRQNSLTMSWSDAQSHTIEDEILFTLVLEAENDIILDQEIYIIESSLDPEAYQGNEINIVDLTLEFDLLEDDYNFTLLANEPNPWNESTNIKFIVNREQTIQFEIFDSNGRIVYNHEESYNKGVHELLLKRSSLKQSGVYYCKMSGAESSITRKIMLID